MWADNVMWGASRWTLCVWQDRIEVIVVLRDSVLGISNDLFVFPVFRCLSMDRKNIAIWSINLFGAFCIHL